MMSLRRLPALCLALTAACGSDGPSDPGDPATGSLQVSLAGVQANCTVQGEHPRTVTVVAGEAAAVQLEVACLDALLGQIAFGGDREGSSEIYVMSPGGGEQLRLTTTGRRGRGDIRDERGRQRADAPLRGSGDLAGNPDRLAEHPERRGGDFRDERGW